MSDLNSKIKLTWGEIIRLIVAAFIFLLLVFLKDIYPHSPFVRKYFDGLYGFTWVVLYFAAIWFIETKLTKRKKSSG